MPKGTGVSTGVGFAQVLVWKAPVPQGEPQRDTRQPTLECKRFERALASLTAKNDAVRQRTARRFGDKEAAIFDAYHMMLSDDDGLLEPVRELIRKQSCTAEYAVTRRFNQLAKQFLELESDYMRQRAEDIYSLRDQMLREMMGAATTNVMHFSEPTIVVAHTLSPADVANMDLSHLEGIVCEIGGYSSHTAIIARTLGIPAVMGVFELRSQIQDGDIMALDGETGQIWINPDRTEIRFLRERSSLMVKKTQMAQLYRGLPTITTDGHRVELATNASRLEELETAIQSDAEAIGMYRTEMMHVNRMPMASEEEQFLTYRHLLDKMGGKSVTVRLFDDGGNQPVLPIKGSNKEGNPVMGYRGIRMCLGRPHFFSTMLRAVLRASAYGDLKILLPFVSTPGELDSAMESIDNVKMQLRREGIPFDDKLPVGVLVETPSIALTADIIAPKVDFFSVAINNLIQFTIAVDRNNFNLSHLYHQFHPAVLRLMKQVCDAAHGADIPCYMCGEAPGHDSILPVLLGFGYDGFSLNPSLVLPSRRILNSCSYVQCYRLAEEVLACNTSLEVEQCIDNYSRTLLAKGETAAAHREPDTLDKSG